MIPASRATVDQVDHAGPRATTAHADLTAAEQRLLGDLLAIVEEHADQTAVPVDRDRLEQAFVYAC